ncbi:bestrophin-like domain [Streptomyces sp. NBC_01244]|uniref:bestrophin-like domain n=1 Tax=Streptomyces sp. NBC_01244 TaxID=2903797 RepID=UPI003FA3B614
MAGYFWPHSSQNSVSLLRPAPARCHVHGDGLGHSHRHVLRRLTQASASIPSAILWFLLATLAITVVALGISLPRRDNRGQLITLIVITALLTTALCIIRDVDRPFGGIINVEPTAITEAERQAIRDFTTNHPVSELPCDEQGKRKTA